MTEIQLKYSKIADFSKTTISLRMEEMEFRCCKINK